MCWFDTGLIAADATLTTTSSMVLPAISGWLGTIAVTGADVTFTNALADGALSRLVAQGTSTVSGVLRIAPTSTLNFVSNITSSRSCQISGTGVAGGTLSSSGIIGISLFGTLSLSGISIAPSTVISGAGSLVLRNGVIVNGPSPTLFTPLLTSTYIYKCQPSPPPLLRGARVPVTLTLYLVCGISGLFGTGSYG